MQLGAAEWNLILSRRWFTDSVVDSYMTLLAKHASVSVLTYSCSWFNTLFFTQNTAKPKVCLFSSENIGKAWFSGDGIAQVSYIIVPGSVSNAHFVVVVIDMHARCIHMCDSMFGTHKNVVSQITRYMCQEYFLTTGQPLDVSLFTYSNYTEWDTHFPKQVDTHSCGAYVCLMAKCILLKKCLRFQSAQSIRITVCYELCNDVLL